MRILLLSAYDANSHQYWRRGLVNAFPEFDWTLLTLPARHFSWRIRGNSLTWALSQQVQLQQPYDLLIATSMTDLSTLRGLQPALTKIPSLVYFHENQFDYPRTEKVHPSIEPQMVTLYTALAADYVLFNSQYNRTSFLQGSAQLLQKLPDHVPAGIAAQLAAKSEVLAVPIFDKQYARQERTANESPFSVIWNHRWEYDKGPEGLLHALRVLKNLNVTIRLHMVGQAFRKLPSAMQQIQQEFTDWIGKRGFIDDEHAYYQLLQQSDGVVSTALHDFQGLAVMEAVAAGCIPIVPDRLAYREIFPPAYRYSSIPNEPEQEAKALAVRIQTLANQHQQNQKLVPPNIESFSWTSLKDAYLLAFETTISRYGK